MRRLLLSVSLALLSVTSSTAFAFDGDHHRHDRYERHDRHWDDYRGDDDHHHRRKHHKHKHRDYHRGERVEVVYLEPRYYVEDYHHYHLRQPPRGHRWVRTEDGRFLLVAVATGIIADILLHH